MGGLIAFLSIIIMIILHEWGHFIAARIFKVPVYEFAIGMGPLIKSKTSKKGTKFSLRAIPIGGYCAFDDEKDSSIQDAALNKIPIWQKIIICFAGPLMNFIAGFLIFICITIGIGVGSETNTVMDLVEGYPAKNVLEVNDVIIDINGTKINNIENTITNIVSNSNGQDLVVTFIRDGETKMTKITPKYDEISEKYYIGILTERIFRRPVGTEYITEPVNNSLTAAKQIFQGLVKLITGKVKLSEMSGIVGIVSYASEYATLATIYSFLSIMATISINLGIMNLLPIPGLDGSKILIGFLEILCGGKRFPEKIESKLTTISFFLLIGLMIIITISDIIKILF